MQEREQQPVIRIEHSGDGTVVYGTQRDDLEAREALTTSGFKWSSGLSAWYLPRTWRFSTRDQRVRQLRARLRERNIEVVGSKERTTTARERYEERREASAERAERLADRAQRERQQAALLRQGADDLAQRFEGGQPILVGHHSERGARRDQQRIWDKTRASIARSEEAERLERAAASAARNAEGTQSPATLGNKVKRLEAEQRDIARKLKGYRNNRGDVFPPAKGEYRERLLSRRSEVEDELGLVNEHLEAARKQRGIEELGPGNVQKGDVVVIRGHPRLVVKVNQKTVSVETGYSWTDKVPYHEITRRIPRAEVENTREGSGQAPGVPSDKATLGSAKEGGPSRSTNKPTTDSSASAALPGQRDVAKSSPGTSRVTRPERGYEPLYLF